MKSFVFNRQRLGSDPVTIAVAMGVMMVAAEKLGEIAYLPLCVFLAIESAKEFVRWRRGSKALLDADRSKGSR
jgi:hypothetical protein